MSSPPPFPAGCPWPVEFEDEPAVPIEIRTVRLRLTLDVEDRTLGADAEVLFRPLRAGFPMLDLVPDPYRVQLGGEDVRPSDFPTVSIRENGAEVTRMRVLRRALRVPRNEECHRLRVLYDLTRECDFDGSHVSFDFFMSDAGEGSAIGRRFLEKYAPSNLEFNPFGFELELTVHGGAAAHKLWTNGSGGLERPDAAPGGGQRWRVEFPRHFTTSSPFVHFVPVEPIASRIGHVARAHVGNERGAIPVTVYGRSDTAVGSVMNTLRHALPKLEKAFGPYAHPELLMYAADSDEESGDGPEEGTMGMEYCGAAVTLKKASVVRHELAHSWFGRGVLPASGDAGWLDEAIVTWHLKNQTMLPLVRGETRPQLAGRSPFHRATHPRAHRRGSDFMRNLDYVVRTEVDREGGLQAALARYYQQNCKDVVTTEGFRGFMEAYVGRSLEDLFTNLVYGGAPPPHRYPRATAHAIRVPS